MFPYQLDPTTGVSKVNADISQSPSLFSEVAFHIRFLPPAIHTYSQYALPYPLPNRSQQTLHVLTMTDLYTALSSLLRNMQKFSASKVTLNYWVRLIQTRVTLKFLSLHALPSKYHDTFHTHTNRF